LIGIANKTMGTLANQPMKTPQDLPLTAQRRAQFFDFPSPSCIMKSWLSQNSHSFATAYALKQRQTCQGHLLDVTIISAATAPHNIEMWKFSAF
jgi:hypothetical protein